MTIQKTDFLIWENENHNVLACNLNLVVVFTEVKFPKFKITSSSCWRGYIATWIIDEVGWLRLSKVDCMIDEESNTVIKNRLYDLFPTYDSPIAALGFSGDVTTGFGENVRPHGLYAISFPHYRIFTFQDGKMMKYEDQDRSWWEKNNEQYALPDFLKKS